MGGDTRRLRCSPASRLAKLTGTSALALILAGVPGWAQQTISGNNTEIVDGDDPAGAGPGTQPSPWSVGTILSVGDQNGDDAALVIRNGGEVSNTIGGIGIAPGASGTVTVTGIGSIWDNSNDLFVGVEGTGALAIEVGDFVFRGGQGCRSQRHSGCGDSDKGLLVSPINNEIEVAQSLHHPLHFKFYCAVPYGGVRILERYEWRRPPPHIGVKAWQEPPGYVHRPSSETSQS